MTRTLKEWDFIHREVYKSKGLKKSLAPTGYEAFRVSPRVSIKYGKEYKKIYGATVEPDYSRGKHPRYGAIVKWYPHGYTSKSVKGGTRLLQPIRSYPVDKKEAYRKLMIRRKTKVRRKMGFANKFLKAQERIIQ